MPLPTWTRRRAALAGASLAAAAALVAGGLATAAPAAARPASPPPGHGVDDVLAPGVPLWTNPDSTTLEAAASLSGQAREDALLLGSVPSATWINGGTPNEAKRDVKRVVAAAHAAGEVPVLVAYNVPFRDCAQYSAGGATTAAEYTAWIDGFAKGIGNKRAVVILEPDGLGIIPHHTALDGTAEWCTPAEADPATAADERYAMLNHAVDAFAALPSTAVYLDATHNGWLNVGDITDRLLRAGVERADGFFLNASNYNFTANLEAYGTWISSCLAYVTEVNPGGYGECGDQYWNGGPANGWNGVTMSAYGEWSSGAPDPALDTAGVDSRYAAILGDIEPTTGFVIDTSRNGQGPWAGPEGGWSGDPELWCNPPARGAGERPTTDTGTPLVDAYLWIKVPGESDGKCFRGTAGPLDPVRGIEAPAAGAWFPEQARELIELADPAF